MVSRTERGVRQHRASAHPGRDPLENTLPPMHSPLARPGRAAGMVSPLPRHPLQLPSSTSATEVWRAAAEGCTPGDFVTACWGLGHGRAGPGHGGAAPTASSVPLTSAADRRKPLDFPFSTPGEGVCPFVPLCRSHRGVCPPCLRPPLPVTACADAAPGLWVPPACLPPGLYLGP